MSLFRTFLALMLSVLLLLAVGCDEDDATTGTDDKQTGDVDDLQFQKLTASMETGELYTDMLLDDIFCILDTVFERAAQGVAGDRSQPNVVTGVEADSVYVTYHEASQYWYVYLSTEVPTDTDTTTTVIIDSVQFLHAEGPVQWPDSALLIGLHTGALLHMVSTTGNEIEATQLLTVMGDIVYQGDVTLNGAQSIDMFFAGDSCAVTMDMSTTATEVAFNVAHVDAAGCPEAGVFSHEGTVGIECTGEGALSYSDNWTVVQTFTGNDTYSVVAENSTTRWTYSGSCGDDEQE